MYKKILVPLDGTPLSEAVLPHAEALAKSEGAEIVILRIPSLPAADLFARNPGMAQKIVEDVEIETDHYLQDETEQITKEGIKVSSMMREGPIPDVILKVAEEIHADVIAMSTHERSSLQKMLVGSVADKVVKFAHIPVMLIHPN